MKIATWNVNSIRTRIQHVVDWLGQNPVNVLCLQETKVPDADFPRLPFEQLGYHLYVSGQKSYNGVALLSSEPLANVSTGFEPILGASCVGELDQQKRVITGVAKGVRIVNLYVPNGALIGSEKYQYKLHWLKMLREYLRSLLAKQPSDLCISGDFNIALENRDLHNPDASAGQVMATDLERQALKEILELGFADVFRKFTIEGGHFSWWDYRAGAFRRNLGWRIDHHYLTSNLYQQAKCCIIDVAPRALPKPSDHTPVVVEF
ncbi:MAG: exodeoxyribonuclease III [Chroococcidiopsidaceae cyanobacterium CP_BM_RX_35]|nr:exodeoxyribonuclease III [Chroococcidiopsidaceae cyanobacterium CP_BM_RX_35]